MNVTTESDLHLFQPPLYQAKNETGWYHGYQDAVKMAGGSLTWDVTAIFSILSFNYACNNRTLVNEIKRKPWLSSIAPDGQAVLNPIPAHGRLWRPYRQIAEGLEKRLLSEALEACLGHDEIYVLLSGGLDSRVTAGVLAKLFHEGKLASKPIAVTWGLPNSRDVVYGREISKILGFEWVYINHNHEFVLRNIDATAVNLGCLVSPMHLHAMLWFETVSKNAVVFASSYGDMIGRAEFAKKHLLELDHLKPVNKFGLLLPQVATLASDQFLIDLRELHERTPGQPKYVLCDHEMHCNYTRGMLAQAMSIINAYCTVYQMFTHQQTYSYMWSIHPSLRFDDIYAELLGRLEPRLLSLPWARTKRALRGKTTHLENSLFPDFHDYPTWISGPVYDELQGYVEPQWYASTGIFDIEKVKVLCDEVKRKPLDHRYYDIFLWLAGFRRFTEWVHDQGVQIQPVQLDISSNVVRRNVIPEREISGLRQFLSRSVFLQKVVKSIRRPFLRLRARLLHPPRETKVYRHF